MKKQIKLSKEELKRLAEALKNGNKKTEKTGLKKELEELAKTIKEKREQKTEENKFIEAGISLEKISPVLKPIAKTQERLEQISSSFLLQRKQENQTIEKPYELEKQKYSSQSGEYKNLEKIQTENLQNPTGIEKGMIHMGFEQAQKRKSQSFFEDKSEQKYLVDVKSLEEVKEHKDRLYFIR
ncbi:MAG: hypothetical protein AABY06_00290 [Nanoarchaeota archaeon]